MFRYTVKIMYPEGPKCLIIWYGGSINLFTFLFCSYQAVAYIEASAVIYQDGKVIMFLNHCSSSFLFGEKTTY